MVSCVIGRDLSIYDSDRTSIRISVDIDPIGDACVDLDTNDPEAIFADKISSETSRSIVTVEWRIEWDQIVGVVEGELGAAESRQITRLCAKLDIPQLPQPVELHLSEHEHGLGSWQFFVNQGLIEVVAERIEVDIHTYDLMKVSIAISLGKD